MTKIINDQKIVFFSENKSELDEITQYMKDGWAIVKLIPNHNYFIGIMEKMYSSCTMSDENKTVYLPPNQKVYVNC